MQFKAFLLKEMHWEDIYPEEFKNFRKEWGKLGRSKESGDYYVQFSNHKNDPYDRVGYKTPDHHDPVGDYAYPLKYVINNPADIWYGRTARWLRVVKDTSRNRLDINHINPAQARWLLEKMGLNSSDMDFALKQMPKNERKLSSAMAKSFFMAVQYDYHAAPVKDDNKDVYPLRTPEMQARLFLRAGIDAIKDSSTKQGAAIINAREPDQIVFLHRSAFQVIKVYKLNQDSQHGLAWISPENKKQRKLAAVLLNNIDGDQIVSGPEDGYFWSRKGRRVYVNFKSVKDTNRKMGEKKHKEFSVHDHYAVTINIDHSDRGKITGEYSETEKFDHIIRDMMDKWKEAGEKTDYSPDTMQAYKQRKQEQRDAWYAREAEKKAAQEAQAEKELIPVLQELGSRLGVVFRPIPGRDYNYAEILDSVTRGIRRGNKDLAAMWQESAENYKRLKQEGYADSLIFKFGYIPGNVGNSLHPDLAQLKQLVNATHAQMPIDGVWTFQYLLQNLKQKEQHHGGV